jgi:hypothetical protein
MTVHIQSLVQMALSEITTNSIMKSHNVPGSNLWLGKYLRTEVMDHRKRNGGSS